MTRRQKSLLVGNLLVIALLIISPILGARVTLASPEGWEIVTTPNGSTSNNYLLGVTAIEEDDVWAVGWYISNSTPTDQTLIQHWDGTQWSTVSSPNPGTSANRLFGVAAVAANDVWAVGEKSDGTDPSETLIVHWNGTSWTAVPSPNEGANQNSLHAISAVSWNDIWAVGSYVDNGLYRTLIMQWNGTAWTIIASPDPGMTFNTHRGIAAINSDDAWAVGQYASLSGGRTLTQHWKDQTWTTISSPNQGGASDLSAITAIASNDVWAVGLYYPCYVNICPPLTLTMHWDGGQWSIVPSPNIGSNSELHGVHALGSDYVWAVGAGSDSGPTQTLTEVWNGTDWSIMTSPNQGTGSNALYGVSATPGTWTQTDGTVWAVGYYNDNQQYPRTLAMRYHICLICDR